MVGSRFGLEVVAVAVRAYILVKVAAGSVPEAARAMEEIPDVLRVDAVTGPADLIVEVQSPDHKSMAETVLTRIHEVEGVRETDTRIVVERL